MVNGLPPVTPTMPKPLLPGSVLPHCGWDTSKPWGGVIDAAGAAGRFCSEGAPGSSGPGADPPPDPPPQAATAPNSSRAARLRRKRLLGREMPRREQRRHAGRGDTRLLQTVLFPGS